MIGVFTQAGFETATRFADGVVEVRLDLQPTPEAEAAIEARARRRPPRRCGACCRLGAWR